MRESQRQKLIRAGLGKVEKSANRRKYKCICPECSDKAIRSHSQQKKHQLNSIAEDLYVFSMKKTMYRVSQEKVNELLVKTPIGSASRYSGYCNVHDTSIFSPIENGNLNIENPEHNFLLLLRAVSHEYAAKRGMYDRQRDVLSKIGDLFSYDGKRHYESYQAGVKYFLEKDAPYYLAKLFDIYESNNWSVIRYNSFTIDRNIGVSSTTCFSPLREQHPKWSIDNHEKIQPFISFSVIPENNQTSVAFVWFDEFDELCGEFKNIDSGQDDIFRLLNTYIFCESEDVCVNPSLWGKLSQKERYEIYSHMGDSDSLPGSNNIPMVLE